MKKEIVVYFGQGIYFLEPGEKDEMIGTARTHTAIINHIDGVLFFDTKEQAEASAELLLSYYGAYFIPVTYVGTIIGLCEAKLNFEKRINKL